jgi:hypothetical protein
MIVEIVVCLMLLPLFLLVLSLVTYAVIKLKRMWYELDRDTIWLYATMIIMTVAFFVVVGVYLCIE